MLENVNSLARVCCERNQTLKACYDHGQITLNEFLDIQAGKVRKNLGITPLCSPEDFFSLAENFTSERVGPELAKKVNSALRLGAICAADHHGGIYCAQTFQSDLLFGQLLKKLGGDNKIIPIISCGQVELNSSTYARGIMSFMNRNNILHFPIFPSKPRPLLAFSAPAMSQEMLSRFRKRFIRNSGILESALNEILISAYEHENIINCSRFESQVTKIGAALSHGLFKANSPVLVYLEMESLLTPLLIRELKDGNNLIARLLFDPRFKKYLSHELLCDVLFKFVDSQGRNIAIKFTPENILSGRDFDGNNIAIPLELENILLLLEQRKLIPGIFLLALITIFERGLTWLNGVFASVYLPLWQEKLINILESEGMIYESNIIREYDMTSYICGPVFAVCQGEGYITPAGPVEFWISKPDFNYIESLINKTRLWDSQIMGLTTMYEDIINTHERENNWYKTITEGSNNCFNFKENIIINV